MQASESHYERDMSERVLSFAYLMPLSPRVQGAKKRVCDLPYSISVKSYKTFSK